MRISALSISLALALALFGHSAYALAPQTVRGVSFQLAGGGASATTAMPGRLSAVCVTCGSGYKLRPAIDIESGPSRRENGPRVRGAQDGRAA